MKVVLSFFFLIAQSLMVQAQVPEGVGQGFDGEWMHVSQQLISLAEATPAEKFAWRPAAGVRSTSEVYMHIVITNYYLLGVGGVKPPADFNENLEKTVTAKPAVIAWLKHSLEFVKTARASATPKELQRPVKLFNRDTTVDAIYLRVIIHANEHMGQLVAYARMTGVAPPWAK